MIKGLLLRLYNLMVKTFIGYHYIKIKGKNYNFPKIMPHFVVSFLLIVVASKSQDIFLIRLSFLFLFINILGFYTNNIFRSFCKERFGYRPNNTAFLFSIIIFLFFLRDELAFCCIKDVFTVFILILFVFLIKEIRSIIRNKPIE